MPSVLFVCTGNQFRSPIAAAAFLKRLNDKGNAAGWRVSSAGIWTAAGQPPLPEAIRAATLCGLLLEGHTTRLVEASILSASDLILVMESGQKEAILIEFPNLLGRVFLLSEVVEGVTYDISNPLASDENSSEEIAREVRNLVWNGYHKICELARRLHAQMDASSRL